MADYVRIGRSSARLLVRRWLFRLGRGGGAGPQAARSQAPHPPAPPRRTACALSWPRWPPWAAGPRPPPRCAWPGCLPMPSGRSCRPGWSQTWKPL